MSRLENRQRQLIFAIYFKRFMMANNRHTFSSYELIAISKEINKTLPPYKYIKNMIITDKPLIKTTTHKIKRKEELALIEGK